LLYKFKNVIFVISFKHIKKMDLLTQKYLQKFIDVSGMEEGNEHFELIFNDWLLEKVLKQIIKDVENRDLESIEGLLQNIPNSVLANYLPEL